MYSDFSTGLESCMGKYTKPQANSLGTFVFSQHTHPHTCLNLILKLQANPFAHKPRSRLWMGRQSIGQRSDCRLSCILRLFERGVYFFISCLKGCFIPPDQISWCPEDVGSEHGFLHKTLALGQLVSCTHILQQSKLQGSFL